MLSKGSEKWEHLGLYMEMTDSHDIVFTYHKIVSAAQETKTSFVYIIGFVRKSENQSLG